MNKMTMNYELVTPKKASIWLKTTQNNRSVSDSTVIAYANDMKNENWDSMTGTAISIDDEGVLRDGQHRLSAIVRSGKSVWMWVCRGVDPNGVYDLHRKRSLPDQTKIIRPDLETVYSNKRTQALVKALITRIGTQRRIVSPAEYFDYVDRHKQQLDDFLSKVSLSRSASKVVSLPVYFGLYLAYMNGEKLEDVASFYDIMVTGMSDSQIAYPVIAYRNYLLDCDMVAEARLNVTTVSRCQYALKKYLTCSCTKRSKSLDKLIWEQPDEGLC